MTDSDSVETGELEADSPSESKPNWRRELESRASEAETELASYKRRDAFRSAGLDPDDARVSYFVKGYEGGIKALKDPGKLAEDTISSGLVRGGASRIASSVMGDPPVQRQHLTTQNLSQELYNDPTGMYNTINVALTQQGAPWGAGNLAHFNYMQEGLSDGSDEYARLMQRIS